MIYTNTYIGGLSMAHLDGFVSIGDGLEILLPPGVENGDSWDVVVEPFTTERQLGSAVLSGDLFLSSEHELLSILRGNLVQTNNTTFGVLGDGPKPDKPTPNYRTPLVEQHFNHIFLAIGRTLFWTDLDNYWNWYPDPSSEADFREIESESENISGLIRVNETLFLHFPTSIYTVEYVGKPTIVRILRSSHGVGCAVHRTLVVHQSVQYFLGLDNFYLSQGGSVTAIGTEIWGQFLRECPNPEETWAYVDVANQEICFVNGLRTYVFNYREGHWTKFSTDNVVAHATSPWKTSFLSIADFGDIIIGEESGSTFEQDKNRGIENLWVSDGMVLREGRKTDNPGMLQPMMTPFLESDDFTYGDMHFMKECNLVIVDATYGEPFKGLRVLVSGKDFISDTSNWREVGVWTKDSPSKSLDFMGVKGRALKYRFELVDGGLRFDGVGRFNGGRLMDGEAPTTFDGSLRFDNPNVRFRPNQIPLFDGSTNFDNTGEFGVFELNAYGALVLLPDKLVGPDK